MRQALGRQTGGQTDRVTGGPVARWAGGCYLSVVGRNLLVQLLVLLGGSFQLGGGRRQRPLGAVLDPPPHSGQELQEPGSYALFNIVSKCNRKN